MIATLHLPDAASRPLTAAELSALHPKQGVEVLTIDFEVAAPALRELLGTAVPGEVLANSPDYLIVAVANAADYDFAPTPSAEADFTRLTGIEPDKDEPLLGPLLIIEA
jgi:hypothetical protein